MWLHCACEGSKQRFVPTGMAFGDNEIKQHRNFSETHFSGVASCGFCLDGYVAAAFRDALEGFFDSMSALTPGAVPTP